MAEEAGTTTAETTTATGTETKAAETTQATETKAAETTATETIETKVADETKAAETKAAETKAEPVDYTKAISEAMPEGVTLDPAAAKAGTELFAKHNLSAEAAKDLVSLYAQQQKAGADGQAKVWAEAVKAWSAETEKSTTPEERGVAKAAALQIFGKDEMVHLEHLGVTNRATFVKALANLGKAIKDDTFVPGNAVGANGVNDARKQFPNSNMNP